MNAAVLKFRGCDYMPIKLKGVLLEHGISQPKLAHAILQKNNAPLSNAAMSLLINWGYYPKSTPEKEIRDQAEVFLRASGVPEEQIATAWDAEGDDRFRKKQPVGAHLGKAAPKPAGFRQHKPEIDPVETQMLSLNAKRHFRLFRDPFQDEVNGPDDVFLSADIRYISEAMFQTAKHGGFLAAIGESGAGKTILRKLLLDRVRDMPIRVIFPQTLDKQKLTATSISSAVINDLAIGTKVPSSPEAQARKVRELLLSSSRADFNHVLLIEEAHDLTISTLKHLKRFYEIEDGFRKLISIILVGQPELKNKLNENMYPDAREVIRRIEVAEMMPLDGDLEKYLTHKFKRLEIDLTAIFAEDAFTGIRDRLSKTRSGARAVQSQLYPLMINNLVTKAMNRAAELGIPQISGDLVREV